LFCRVLARSTMMLSASRTCTMPSATACASVPLRVSLASISFSRCSCDSSRLPILTTCLATRHLHDRDRDDDEHDQPEPHPEDRAIGGAGLRARQLPAASLVGVADDDLGAAKMIVSGVGHRERRAL